MLANRFVRLSVVYALIGMALGIAMAITGDHSEMPTHAHINLLGYVSMMLYGLFYKSNRRPPRAGCRWYISGSPMPG